MFRVLAIMWIAVLLPLNAQEVAVSGGDCATNEQQVFSVLPPDVSPGTPQRLRVRGVFADGDVSVRLAGLEVPASCRVLDVFRVPTGATEDPGAAEGVCEMTVELTLPAEAPSGTNVALVVATSQGDSRPYPLFVASPGRVVSESEPNDQFESAPDYPTGQTVRGSLGTAGDEDVYRVHLLSGQTLRAEVWSSRLGLPLDASLGLHDRRGMALMLLDDGDGTGADPVLEFQAPGDGPVLLAVRRQKSSPWGDAATYLLDVTVLP